jgi:hypothetical protein
MGTRERTPSEGTFTNIVVTNMTRVAIKNAMKVHIQAEVKILPHV